MDPDVSGRAGLSVARLPRIPIQYSLQHLIWSGVDLLFPPRCAGCGLPGYRWCPQCAASVQHPPEPLCEVCGVPLDRGLSLCNDCRKSRPRFCALRAWSVYEPPIRTALHRLKYRRDAGLAEALAPQLADFLLKLQWPVDMIVPVPLGRKRLKERGYNQASLIARPLAVAMRIDFAPGALVRAQETRSQVGLTRKERRANVRDAFQASGARVSGRTVLLVDDIATTGSTLSSCAEALVAARARDVFAYTVSRAAPKHGLRNV